MNKTNNTKTAKILSRILKKAEQTQGSKINIETEFTKIFPFIKEIPKDLTNKLFEKQEKNMSERENEQTRLKLITLNELKYLINKTPNKKSSGCSGLTYEILKLLNNKNMENLLNIFNACLKPNTIH
jgi:hypothetical protein